MRNQVSTTLSTVTTSTPLFVNREERDFKLGLYVTATATITYTVEHSPTEVNMASTAAYDTYAVWFAVTGLSAATASAAASLDRPCVAVRLNVTAVTGGTAYLTVVQGGAGSS